jgi:tRNA A37 threonylcarbamoyladenosine synthetase subunit TsaC/SUA5/YrdC
VVNIKNLVGIGILDDPKQEKCFKRIGEIKRITKDIPLQICCDKEEFTLALRNKSLPYNIMYWINSGVASVEEANKIMGLVCEY